MKKLNFLILFFLISFTAYSQSKFRQKIWINEVFLNEEGGWIEFYNSSNDTIWIQDYYLKTEHESSNYYPLNGLISDTIILPREYKIGTTKNIKYIASEKNKLYLYIQKGVKNIKIEEFDILEPQDSSSFGHYQNGYKDVHQFYHPTPGFANTNYSSTYKYGRKRNLGVSFAVSLTDVVVDPTAVGDISNIEIISEKRKPGIGYNIGIHYKKNARFIYNQMSVGFFSQAQSTQIKTKVLTNDSYSTTYTESNYSGRINYFYTGVESGLYILQRINLFAGINMSIPMSSKAKFTSSYERIDNETGAIIYANEYDTESKINSDIVDLFWKYGVSYRFFGDTSVGFYMYRDFIGLNIGDDSLISNQNQNRGYYLFFSMPLILR